ncbi:MAG: transposase [Proteobacteria bacterium]|nr:transposase [Pseudomonadota bacterium]
MAAQPPRTHRVPTQRERFLSEMERALPWAKLRALVEPVYADPKGRLGRPLELDRMLRIHFLQRWFQLSDAAMHEALVDSAAMRAFACVGLGPGMAPGEIEICGFRRLLGEYGLGNALADAVDRHLSALGLAVSPGAIVDASIASLRPAATVAWRTAGETRQ